MMLAAGSVRAASVDGTSSWIPWLILGAIGLPVVGVALRMFLAARFPKGYREWAQSRSDSFAENNAKWDSEDEGRK